MPTIQNRGTRFQMAKRTKVRRQKQPRIDFRVFDGAHRLERSGPVDWRISSADQETDPRHTGACSVTAKPIQPASLQAVVRSFSGHRPSTKVRRSATRLAQSAVANYLSCSLRYSAVGCLSVSPKSYRTFCWRAAAHSSAFLGSFMAPVT